MYILSFRLFCGCLRVCVMQAKGIFMKKLQERERERERERWIDGAQRRERIIYKCECLLDSNEPSTR